MIDAGTWNVRRCAPWCASKRYGARRTTAHLLNVGLVNFRGLRRKMRRGAPCAVKWQGLGSSSPRKQGALRCKSLQPTRPCSEHHFNAGSLRKASRKLREASERSLIHRLRPQRGHLEEGRSYRSTGPSTPSPGPRPRSGPKKRQSDLHKIGLTGLTSLTMATLK